MATETVNDAPAPWLSSGDLAKDYSLTELHRAFTVDNLEFARTQLLRAAKWADQSEAPEIHRQVMAALDSITGILEEIGVRPAASDMDDVFVRQDTLADEIEMDRQMDADRSESL